MKKAGMEKLNITLWSFLLAGMLVVGCGGGQEGGEEGSATDPNEKILRVSQGSDVLSFDPYYQLESPTMGVQINIFEPLVGLDPNMDFEPLLATEWRNIEPLKWEFKLREGVKFHNGNTFDAQDVQYSLKRAVDWPQSKVRSEIPTVVEVEAIDPYTVHVITAVPDGILPRRLASVLIMDKESSSEDIKGGKYELRSPTGVFGTGPYKLERWLEKQYAHLVVNDDYWGDAPVVRQIRFEAMSNPGTRVATLLKGDLDIMSDFPVQDVDQVKQRGEVEIIESPSLRLIYLGLDVGREQSPGVPDSPPNPLQDIRVRQAIYQGINEPLIIEKIMHGHASIADQLFPEPVQGFDGTITRPAYDPENAKRLLAEAGYPNGFKIRLDAPNNRYVNDAKIASAVAQELAKIGIQVEVNAVPKARFFEEEREGRMSFFLIGWANTNGSGLGTFDHLLHTPDSAKNLGGSNQSCNYSNPRVDELSEQAAQVFDETEREVLLQEANRVAMADLPHIPLHYQNDIYAKSKRVIWEPRSDTQIRGLEVRWAE